MDVRVARPGRLAGGLRHAGGRNPATRPCRHSGTGSQLAGAVASAAPNSPDPASSANRQARFLQEIDRLAEARRTAGMPRPKGITSPTPGVLRSASGDAGPAAFAGGPAVPGVVTGSAPPASAGAMVRSPTQGSGGSIQRSAAEVDAALARNDSSKFVKAKFVLCRHVEYGQRIKVVGSDPGLGNWQLKDGAELKWAEGDRWNVTVELPAGGVFEYKYVIVAANGTTAVDWQWGNNNVLALKPDEDRVEIIDNWDCSPGAAVIAANGESQTRETRLKSWAGQMDALVGSQRAELRRTRMELVASQEESRLARADSSRLKAQLARTQTDLLTAERRVRDLQRTNQVLRAQLAESSLTFHKAFETAQRLLAGDENAEPLQDMAGGPAALPPPNDAAKLAASASNLLSGSNAKGGNGSATAPPSSDAGGAQGGANSRQQQGQPPSGQQGFLSVLNNAAAGLMGRKGDEYQEQQQQQGGRKNDEDDDDYMSGGGRAAPSSDWSRQGANGKAVGMHTDARGQANGTHINGTASKGAMPTTA